jgi:site-specific DNA-methyltransferase (adenine-specific)
MLRAMRSALGENDMMAYLAMMTVRLIELRRILKSRGSLYLHCDPTASHYLKVLLDAVFGPRNFRAEIVWKRYGAHSNSNMYGAVHDIILFYVRGDRAIFNKQYTEYDEEYIRERFKFADPDGRRWAEQNLGNPAVRPNLMYDFTAANGITYKHPDNGWKYTPQKMRELDQQKRLHYPMKKGGRLRLKSYHDELPGVQLQDVWTDLTTIGGTSEERLGYPTQKPLALLERIIAASSNEGDVVLDPFCGCGTAVHAAEKLNRQWIGIDITHLAIGLIERRLKDAFPRIRFEVHGTPKDFAGAEDLARRDKFQFQWWAVTLINAVPYGGKKKGADTGIDGYYYCKPDGKATEAGIVSVKGGETVHRNAVGELRGVMERENAPLGVLITLREPTRPMIAEAAAARYFDTPFGRFPRIQIATVADLLDGRLPRLPPQERGGGYRRAEREAEQQQKLL